MSQSEQASYSHKKRKKKRAGKLFITSSFFNC
jgi:hypothetical protein